MNNATPSELFAAFTEQTGRVEKTLETVIEHMRMLELENKELKVLINKLLNK